ncbi:uncharacterized protein LOC108907424 [Anoplophora glabripennis]|uniref:uncharacterized protein LOC108907424 n=1 Tax=Anoplophora glabripennis TaxID=217634 RepID=UPI000873B10F|nr:uncharacterized protein LOC108907424 [Anoplophora glabripennis]
MSGETLPTAPGNVNMKEDTPTEDFDEKNEDPDPAGDFEHHVLQACKEFTHTMNDLNTRKTESLARNRRARILVNKAMAAKESARQDVGRKQANVKSLRTRLESLQRQLASAEEELQCSRQHHDKCISDEDAANKQLRYSVKDLHKYEMADQVTTKYIVNYFKERNKVRVAQYIKASQGKAEEVL